MVNNLEKGFGRGKRKMSKPIREPEHRFGVIEPLPVCIPYVTIEQPTNVWTGKSFERIGLRYSRVATKALSKEIKEYLETGHQPTQKDRIKKLQDIVKRQRKK